MTRYSALIGPGSVFSALTTVNIGQALAAPSFDRPMVVDGLGGCRNAPRGWIGRCDIVGVLATCCGWSFEHDHPRGDCLLLVGRLGVRFVVSDDCVFVPGLGRTDRRVL